jgi:N-terminal acetyltransferase B complex non-catalytic subunit
MQTTKINNIFLSDINNQKSLSRYIRSSIINDKAGIFNENISKDYNNINANNKLDENNNYFSLNNGANIISPINNNSHIRKMKNNIEEIVIKTNYPKQNLNFNNTTPLPIYKQRQKYKLSNIKVNIKKFLLADNDSTDKLHDSKNSSLENTKRKTFSKSFREYSNYNIKEDKDNFLSLENSRRLSSKNKYIKKILHNSDIKSKSRIKINIQNINNKEKNKKIFAKKNLNLIPINPKGINNNLNNNINAIFNNQMTNVTNVTFDTSVQNDFFNFTDENNQNNENEIKTTNNNIENEIKLKIQENNEIKANIILLIEEINKIKERQEQIINIENTNKIKNNEKNIKISNIIKKTYNFLNDFNKVINEQNQQIYQEILFNLKMFFNN